MIIICYFNNLETTLVNTYTIVEEILNGVYSVSIFIISFLILFQNKMPAQQKFYTDQKWLKQFMILGAIVVSFWILAILMNLTLSLKDNTYLYYPLRLSSSILIFWIGYQGLFHYKLIDDRISLRESIKSTDFNNSLNSKLKSIRTQSEKFNKLNDYIIKNKKYLDPLFTLENLSNEYHLSMSYISHLVNAHIGFNFSDYVNHLRVEYAKELLINEDYSQYTIIAIGLESGFNSKSTFYTAFKKFTKKTPIQYRNQK